MSQGGRPDREDEPPEPEPEPEPEPNAEQVSGRGGDLAGNVAGIGITHEAARRRQAEGAGADRSWRVGADGEAEVAALLATLTTPSWSARLRGRASGWFVLHSVELGDGRGRMRGDVDHLVIGPPGVVSINTKHHPAGRVVLDGDQLYVNRHPTDYVAKARREAERVVGFLRPALTAAGRPDLAQRVPVRPVVALVDVRLTVEAWPAGVTVTMSRELLERLRAFPAALDAEQATAVYEVARLKQTWNPMPGRHSGRH
jgi:hypothetical protein